MRLELDRLGQIKVYIHAAQAGILFLAWILTIAIYTRDGKSGGRIGWYFALCFITIPILVYLVMVPMWSRAHKFANVHAFAALDALSVALWLSAWASTASYVAEGKGSGTNTQGTGCDNFQFGSPGRCKLATGTTILGVFEMLLFIATAVMSLRSVMLFKRTGISPLGGPRPNDFSSQTKDAFSSNMHNDVFDDHDEPDRRQGHGYSQSTDEEYAPVHQGDHDDRPYGPPGLSGQGGLGIHDYDTSYGGAQGQHTGGRQGYGNL